MSERVDRDALIAAAKEAARARGWITEWTTVAAMVDAVVPLIADAIETARRPMPDTELVAALATWNAHLAAARLVRSFGGAQ
jgi:hypothetical protein